MSPRERKSGLEYVRFGRRAPMRLVTFDPGITTGIVQGTVTPGNLDFRAGQAEFSVKDLFYFLRDYNPEVVIYETFEYRNRARKGLELFPVQLIGVINLWGQIHPYKKLYPQTPGTGFDRYSNAELKRLGYYQPGKPHAMDALRHTLHWWEHGPGYKINLGG